MLRQLNLLRNPIQELPDYRLSILFQIQRLTELDRHKVEVDEKVVYPFRISRSLCSLFNIFFGTSYGKLTSSVSHLLITFWLYCATLLLA